MKGIQMPWIWWRWESAKKKLSICWPDSVWPFWTTLSALKKVISLLTRRCLTVLNGLVRMSPIAQRWWSTQVCRLRMLLGLFLKKSMGNKNFMSLKFQTQHQRGNYFPTWMQIRHVKELNPWKTLCHFKLHHSVKIFKSACWTISHFILCSVFCKIFDETFP